MYNNKYKIVTKQANNNQSFNYKVSMKQCRINHYLVGKPIICDSVRSAFQ